MEWREVSPLPQRCIECKEIECYNCDYALDRWYLPREEELKIHHKWLLGQIERTTKPNRLKFLRLLVQKVERELEGFKND